MEISDAEFWKIVADIDWGNKKKDQEHTQEKLALMFGPEKSEALYDKTNMFHCRLCRAIEKWEKDNDERLGCGDDSFSDITYHIIGLGETVFNANMKDPGLAFERSERGDYRESFGYLIPSKFTFEHHWAKLPEREAQLLASAAELRKDFPALYMLFDEVEDMIHMAGNLPMTCKEIQARFKEISNIVERAETNFAVKNFFSGWAYVNYITDMQKIGDARREIAAEAGSKV